MTGWVNDHFQADSPTRHYQLCFIISSANVYLIRDSSHADLHCIDWMSHISSSEVSTKWSVRTTATALNNNSLKEVYFIISSDCTTAHWGTFVAASSHFIRVNLEELCRLSYQLALCGSCNGANVSCCFSSACSFHFSASKLMQTRDKQTPIVKSL